MRRLATSMLIKASALFGGLVAVVGVGSLLLTFLLYQPSGCARMSEDWWRLQVSQTLGSASVTSAFNGLYADSIGRNANAEQVQAWYSRQLRAGGPLVLDAVLANYIHREVGQVDGRTLPAGVYVGAGPVGPDFWPMPVVSHFLFFPRHGYVLVVPFAEDGASPPAVEITASIEGDFRGTGPAEGDLFAVQQPYQPGAFDFPRAGEPIHDLFPVTNDPEEVRQVRRRLDGAVQRLSAARLSYRTLDRNSNSALGCFLRVSGVRRDALERLGSSRMVRLRLPGIAQDLWPEHEPGALPECTSR